MLITVLAVSALALSACSGSSGGSGSGGTSDKTDLNLAVGVPLSGFSPQVIGDGYALQWMQAAYDTLTFAEADGTYSPMLATQWEYDDSQTKLTLDLRADVKFSDGTALDAEAVKKSLEATRDSAGGSASALAAIDEVTALDADTVELELKAPDPSLIRSLSQVAGMIANPKSVGTDALDAAPDGSGPYTLDADASVAGTSYVLQKKDDYWNTDLSLPFQKITIQSMPDQSAVLNALLSGQVDSSFIVSSNAEQATAQGLTVTQYSAPGAVGLYLWDRDGKIVPELKDVRVRQAINHAIDREALLTGVRAGHGTVTEQLFRPDWDSSDEALNASYSFDPAKAKALLKEAGYEDGFTVEILQNAAMPENDLVAQMLADVGITVKWKPTTNIVPDIQSGDTGLSIFQLASQAEWQLVTAFLLPNSPWNPLKSTDPQVEQLIEQAQQAGDDAARSAALKELNTYLVEQAWFAPFYFLTGNYASTNGVTVQAPYINVPAIYDFQLG
ncbi:ABC transporter substrate-binding protein [Kineosporia babensis]